MAAARAARRPLDAATPLAVAAREAVATRTAAVVDELAAARAGKVEGVHQLRVAVRRVRTTLRLYRRALPRRTADALDRDLAALGRAVGPVRDLDVLALAVAKRGRRIDPALAPAVATVLRHVRDRRAAAHALLVATLDAPGTARTIARLESLARSRGGDGTPVGAVAGELVRPLVRDLARAARRHERDPSDETMHRLRIRAKRVRYALEALDGLGGPATRTLVARLARLQRVFGDRRDAASQRAWLLDAVPAFAGDAEALVALGAVAEALRRRERRLGRRARRAWRRVGHPSRSAAMTAELERGAVTARRAA